MISLLNRLPNVLILLAVLALVGCSTVYRVTNDILHPQANDVSPEEFYARTGGDLWNIVLVTGQRRTATILSVPGDSVALVSQRDSVTIPIRQIQSVSKKKSLDALVLYPFVGMVGGALAGMSVSSKSNFKRDDVGLLTGTGIGIAGGLTIAIFFPPRVVYEFSLVGDNR